MELGRWPWSRRMHARLVERLSLAGAKVIALDIAFAEPDAADPDADLELAAAIKASGRVILPVLPEQTRLGGQLVETLPIPALTQAAAGLGHVDVEASTPTVWHGASISRRVWEIHTGRPSVSPCWSAPAARQGSRCPECARRRPSDRRFRAPLTSGRVTITSPFPSSARRGASPASPTSMPCAARYRPAHCTTDSCWWGQPPLASLSFADPRVVPGSARCRESRSMPTRLDALRLGLTLRPLPPAWHALITAALVLLPALIYPRLAPQPGTGGRGLLCWRRCLDASRCCASRISGSHPCPR